MLKDNRLYKPRKYLYNLRIQRELNNPVTVLKCPVNFIIAYITYALTHYPNTAVLKDKMVSIKEWIHYILK